MRFIRGIFVVVALVALSLPAASSAYSFGTNYRYQYASAYQYPSVAYSYSPVGYPVTIGTPYYGNTVYYGHYPPFTSYPQQNMGYVGTDFWGSPLCYWEGYGVSDCSFNPHQWLYDPYTSTWY